MTLTQWQSRTWVLRFDELGEYLRTKSGTPFNPNKAPKARPDQALIDAYLASARLAPGKPQIA